ncbi:MAG: hypothetical protein KDK27_00605 [Leptospiraceae bacterium]|nr:hypothetical protein [Leptospiraceae bacterium]
MKNRLKIIFAIVLLLFTGIQIQNLLATSWQFYINSCPNKDVLTWDANLRLSTVLDQYQDFRDHHFGRAILPFIDSPTWPTLRHAIALIVFSLSPDGPGPVLDVAIGFVFYTLLFPSLLIVAFEITRDWFRASIIWFGASMLVLHAREIPAYGLSSMLESQGMFFLLWSMYFLFKLYEQQQLRRTAKESGIAAYFPRRRRIWFGLFISALCLFFTKYPYGIMLILAVVSYEIIRSPRRVYDLLTLIITRHYSGNRIYVPIVAAGFLAIVFLLNYFIADFSRKFVKYSIWFVVTVLFIDLNVYFYKYRVELRQIMDTVRRHFYTAVILPAAVWMLIHPDRVSSTIGTQQHEQQASLSFFNRLFSEDVFAHATPIILLTLLAGLAILMMWFGFYRQSNGKLRYSFQKTLTKPETAFTFILIFQFLILELLTANKQLRHIYHLLPAIFLILSAWCLYIPRLIRVRNLSSGNWPRYLEKALYAIFYAVPLTAVIFLVPTLESKIKEGRPLDLVSISSTYPYYTISRSLCMTEMDQSLYQPVRELAEKISPRKRYILVNAFHDKKEAYGITDFPIDRPNGYMLASDFDLLFRFRTLHLGAVRNESEDQRKYNWKNFDSVLLLTRRCRDARWDRFINERASEYGVEALLHATFSHISGEYCLREYVILPPINAEE